MPIVSQDVPRRDLISTRGAAKTTAEKHVLVVDDEPAIRTLLYGVFADAGYRVSRAANGAEALQQVRLSRPDIVVVDLMMPIMDGLEFARQCRQLDGPAELPIILLSATFDARKASLLSAMGVRAFLGKPFDISELLALVELHACPTPVQRAAERWPAHQPARVLLVLDEPLVVQIARLTLSHGVCETRNVATRSDVMAAVARYQPHLMLLDADSGSSSIMQHIGAREPGRARIPTIGLTRRGDLRSKLAAFDAGVDDILTVPFAPEELLARVIAVARRSYDGAVAFTPVIQVGRLQLDILKRAVRADRSELHLTSLEQSLLYLLAANAGRVLSCDDIANMLWGADAGVESGTVEQQVRNLRARLLTFSEHDDFIATVPGVGYRFLSTCASAVEIIGCERR
jgi:DNA-binding response OmpR family regulator